MTQEVLTLLTACVVGKDKNDFGFTLAANNPVKDLCKAWHAVCVQSGVGHFIGSDCDQPVETGKKCACGSRKRKYRGLLVHDLRRTGEGNLRRLDVSESVGMKIGGWKTESVYRRYDIIDEADITDAAQRLDEKVRAEFGQNGRKWHRE
jgi:hypothetical protein